MLDNKNEGCEEEIARRHQSISELEAEKELLSSQLEDSKNVFYKAISQYKVKRVPLSLRVTIRLGQYKRYVQHARLAAAGEHPETQLGKRLSRSAEQQTILGARHSGE